MNPDLTSWLIENYGQEKYAPDPELRRVKTALGPLVAKLQSTSKIVIIAGTNGKGETILRLSAHLQNYHYCAWMSPHILRPTERFRDENGEIDPQELKEIIFTCHEEVREKNFHLTYYEFLFLVFCTWAARKGPQYLLLEVGLGGRLDAVNVFSADLVLLPSVSRDHQEFLGNRYDLILREKLGVLRSQSFLLSFLPLKYLRERADAIVREVGAGHLDLEEAGIGVPQEFSRRNSLLAHAAYEYLRGNTKLNLSDWSHERESFPPSLEHRGEVIQRGAHYVFFGSHNVDGMRKLIQFLHSDNYTFSRTPFDAVLVAFSQRNERDLRTMLRMLKRSKLGSVIVTTFPHPKTAAVEELKNLCLQEGMCFAENMETYVHGANSDQHFLVTGSYYFLGHFKSLLGG